MNTRLQSIFQQKSTCHITWKLILESVQRQRLWEISKKEHLQLYTSDINEKKMLKGCVEKQASHTQLTMLIHILLASPQVPHPWKFKQKHTKQKKQNGNSVSMYLSFKIKKYYNLMKWIISTSITHLIFEWTLKSDAKRHWYIIKKIKQY